MQNQNISVSALFSYLVVIAFLIVGLGVVMTEQDQKSLFIENGSNSTSTKLKPA